MPQCDGYIGDIYIEQIRWHTFDTFVNGEMVLKTARNIASLMIILKIYELRERKDIDRGQTNAGCQEPGTDGKNAAGD